MLKNFCFFSESVSITKTVKNPGFYMLEKTKQTKGIPTHTSVGIDKKSVCKFSEKMDKPWLSWSFNFFEKKDLDSAKLRQVFV